MERIRFNLGVLLTVASGAIVALAMGITHFEGWERWTCAGGTAVTGVLAFALTIVLGMTFLTTTGDLWDTWWFRTMRKCWGNGFGGPDTITNPNTREVSPRPLQISICKAVNLSAVTIVYGAAIATLGLALVLLVVSFLIAGAGTIAYLAIVGAWSGIATPSNFLFDPDITVGHNIAAFLMLGGIVFSLVVYGTWAFAISMLPVMRKSKKVSKTFLSILIVTSTCILLVAPMRTIGVGPVLVWIGIVLVGISGIALVVVLLVVSIWGITKFSKKLSHETVPGVLARGWIKTWKEKLCPLIIQDEKFAL